MTRPYTYYDCDSVLPDPIISRYDFTEIVSNRVRFWVSIDNYQNFSNGMFGADRSLEPCGDRMASKTSIRIVDANSNRRLSEICALRSMPSEVMFAAEPCEVKTQTVRMVLEDAACQKSHVSNPIIMCWEWNGILNNGDIRPRGRLPWFICYCICAYPQSLTTRATQVAARVGIRNRLFGVPHFPGWQDCSIHPIYFCTGECPEQ